MTVKTEGSTVRVLYDGWPLARQPDGPAALHLLTMLELHPPGVQALLALPAPTIHPLPEAAALLHQTVADSAASRLRWEQKTLPELAVENCAVLLHQTSGSPPLWSKVPCLVSPTAFSEHSLFEDTRSSKLSWIERLRQAAGWGGLAGKAPVLWPEDLPLPRQQVATTLLPGIVHPLFQPGQAGAAGAQERFRLLTGEDLPETYILYHGPAGETDLERLFSAWSWAEGPIGDYYPLILAGEAGRPGYGLPGKPGLASSARVLPELPVAALAALYQGSSLLFHPAEVTAWGDPVRMALACGKPVVALDSPRCAALVGPAAYLAPDDASGRALGAALLTVVVEESLSASLGEAALQRAAKLDGRLYTAALESTYRGMI